MKQLILYIRLVCHCVTLQYTTALFLKSILGLLGGLFNTEAIYVSSFCSTGVWQKIYHYNQPITGQQTGRNFKAVMLSVEINVEMTTSARDIH